MAWYNKYRPKDFSEVIGQDLVVKVLENSILRNKVKHAYLFSGPRGVGKTTLARIFANKLLKTDSNSHTSINLIELDAASNTGIDTVRQLIESSTIPPINADYKIYIIDEVHMLSKSAMNALLKTLEEPPTYLIFLLATTNPEKLLPTVLSRVTHLRLVNHTPGQIKQSLEKICQKEKLKISQKALELLVKKAAGSQRDAINLLETLAGYELENFDEDQVARILGLYSRDLFVKVSEMLLKNDYSRQELESMDDLIVDSESFLNQLLEFLLDDSLLGEKKYATLVMSVYSVVVNKYPFTGFLSFFALVKAFLQDQSLQQITIQNDLEFDKKKISPKKSTQNKVKTRTNPEVASSATPNLNIPSLQKDYLKVLNAELENLQKYNFNEFFQNLSKIPECPARFKILANDIQAFVEKDSLVVTVSNAVFLNKISLPEIQQFLKDQIQKKLQLQLKIDFRQRKTLISDQIFDQDLQSQDYPINTDFDEPLTTPENVKKSVSKKKSKSSPKVTDNSKGKIFYKVYKNKPPNFEPSKIEVYPGPIPDPKDAKNSWESQVTEIFELE